MQALKGVGAIDIQNAYEHLARQGPKRLLSQAGDGIGSRYEVAVRERVLNQPMQVVQLHERQMAQDARKKVWVHPGRKL
jgi:hypothetical protein